MLLTLLACTEPGSRISGVPHVFQRPDFCGEACVEMALRHRGLDVDQDAVFDLAGVDPALGRGARAAELTTAIAALGFSGGVEVTPASRTDAAFEALYADLRAGWPSILCVRADDASDAPEHFILVTGFAGGTVYYSDPARIDGADLSLSRARLLARWRLPGDVLIRLRLVPGALRAPAPSAGFTAADFAQEVRVVRELVPPGFTLRVEPPFLVVGEDAALVAELSEHTVRPAVAGLRRAHFDRDPEAIFTIWLFSGAESYRAYAWSIFGDRPGTPFGYASLDDRALVMNIATGAGTLIHEIVHPYVHAELPTAAPWFNEGLASLYEQTAFREGRLVGLENWRLPGLQWAISRGMVGDFPTLLGMDARGFYDGDDGTHYAQARYLCLWLQEQGLLEGYYRALRAAPDDPTGIATLRATLGTDDLAAFQRLWEEWVMGLAYP